MPIIDQLIAWVDGREQLLSGLAALVVLIGVVISPLGQGLRIVHKRRRLKKAGKADQPGEHHGTPPSVRDRPSIAVLPFDNMSSDHEQDYLADGMAEDIITVLSKDRRLFVVARNTTFAYKGKAPDIRRVGHDLGVHHVLEGSLRRVGDRLRITAQLIDARTGAHVWAETLDRPLADIVAAQDEAAHRIVAGVIQRLFHDPPVDIVRAEPETLRAWELGALATMQWASGPDQESASESERLLRIAVKKEPDSAAAWSLLANQLAFQWMYDPACDFATTSAQARMCVERALALAPHDPAVLGTQGAVLVYGGHCKQAVPLLRRVIAQLPVDIGFRINLATALGLSGYLDEALAEMEEAGRIGAQDVLLAVYQNSMADLLVSMRRYAESEPLVRESIAGVGRNGWAWVTLALSLAGQNRLAEARAAAEEIRSTIPGFTRSFYERVCRTLYAGDEPAFAERLRLMTLALSENVATVGEPAPSI